MERIVRGTHSGVLPERKRTAPIGGRVMIHDWTGFLIATIDIASLQSKIENLVEMVRLCSGSRRISR